MHWWRVKKHGNPDTVLPKLGRRRAEIITYAGAHKRACYDKGWPSEHVCVDCGAQAHDWSYVGGSADERYEVRDGHTLAYSVDPADYVPRCISCHRKADGAGNRPRNHLGQFI
jgi:hypothetical protein